MRPPPPLPSVVWYTRERFLGLNLAWDGHAVVSLTQLRNWRECPKWGAAFKVRNGPVAGLSRAPPSGRSHLTLSTGRPFLGAVGGREGTSITLINAVV